MTTKWAIRKYPKTSFGSVNPCPWLAFAPGVEPTKTTLEALHLPDDDWLVAESLPQLLKRIRTVEAELPKVYRSGAINHKDLGHDKGVMINSGDVDVVIRTISGDATIHNKNLKPLAEYLLALHYEKENK